MGAAMTASSMPTAEGANVLAMLAVTTVLVAVVFLLLGFFRLGSAVRFVPYPVIGGFLASTGWLIATGALRVVADLPHGADVIEAIIRATGSTQVLATLVLGLVFLNVFRKYRHPAVLPVVLALSSVAVIVGLRLAGLDEAQAREAGWLFDISTQAQWTPAWEIDFREVRWSLVGSQWLDMFAVAAVAVITLLLSFSGLEVMSRQDISFDHELREHGWLNLALSVLGGFVSIVSVSRSAVLLESGARSRFAGMIAGAFCLLAMSAASLVLGWLPKVVLAGFLFYLGIALLNEWLVVSRRRLGPADWSLILIILTTTALVGFTIAVLAGILISCLNFALSYSRLGAVQHDVDGTGIRSSVQRPGVHRQLLTRYGQSIRVLMLRGVIFFGTASSVLELVRDFLQAPRAPVERVLVLDFSRVRSADSSAGLTFTKIAQLAADHRVRLVICGLGPDTRDVIAQAAPSAKIFPTLDLALDEAEQGLLSSLNQDPYASDEPLSTWMTRELGAWYHWQALQPLLERRDVTAGEVLMRQGDSSAAGLYLIESGRLSVTLKGMHDGQRLACLMGGSMVGEMALYDSSPRSANVTAERDSVVWSLSRAALEQLQATAPETGMQFHALVMRTMAERVRQANKAISALQR
jgi:SulP family sulfate permease